MYGVCHAYDLTSTSEWLYYLTTQSCSTLYSALKKSHPTTIIPRPPPAIYVQTHVSYFSNKLLFSNQANWNAKCTDAFSFVKSCQLLQMERMNKIILDAMWFNLRISIIWKLSPYK